MGSIKRKIVDSSQFLMGNKQAKIKVNNFFDILCFIFSSFIHFLKTNRVIKPYKKEQQKNKCKEVSELLRQPQKKGQCRP